MKTLITDYTFNKTSGTLTFNDYTSILQEGLLLITNTTDNIMLYNFADPTYKATVLGNVVTLTYDTSSMDDTDDIQIWYDDGINSLPVGASTEESQERMEFLLQQLTNLIAFPTYSVGGASIVVSGSVAVAGMTGTNTITTVTGLTNIGGYSAAGVTFDTSAISWGQTIRNNLI